MPPVQHRDAPRSAAAPAPKSVRSKAARHKGFDPYNSGAFERNAWDRVNR